MQTYLLKSDKIEGEIIFKFDDYGVLINYDSEGAKLTPKQQGWLLSSLPVTIEDLQEKIKTSGAKLTKQHKGNWTFEEFWPMAYVNKGSSKKVSLKIWNRLLQKERDKAANYWPVYLRFKNDGEGIKYVETYLRSEIWNN